MPQPTSSDVHVSQLLTDVSVAYMQDASAFVAAAAFPVVPVAHQGNKYATYTRADFFRILARKRATGTESAGGGFGTGSDTYFCEKYAFHQDVDDDTRDNADDPFQLDRDAAEFVALQMLLIRESVWMTNYFTTGKWGTDRTGNASPTYPQFLFWDNANADPIADIRVSCTAVQSATGYRPNTLVIGPTAWDAVADCPAVLDRIKHTQTGITTPPLVAAACEIDRVLVAKGVRNTAAEGATEATSFFAGEQALLCYAAPRPGLKQPSAGYTFAWTGRRMSGPFGNRMKTFRMENVEADRVEGDICFDCKKVAGELGVFFNDCLT